MIEKMKKLTLLVYHASHDKFLNDLQDLGAVHLELDSGVCSDEITALKDKVGSIAKAVRVIDYFKKDINPAHRVGNVDLVVKEIEDLKSQYDKSLFEMESLEREINYNEPFGDFNPEMTAKLRESGIEFKIFSATKAAFVKIKELGLTMETIFEHKGSHVFAVFYQTGEKLPVFDAVEERIPTRTLKDLRARKIEVTEEVKNLSEKLSGYAVYEKMLKDEEQIIYDKLMYAFAKGSGEKEVEDKIVILRSFFPKKSEKKIKEFLDGEDVAYLIENPAPEDDVPIKLKNGPVSSLFEPIGKLFSLPSYMEIDTVPFFAPFFALFFGMCLGDLGYGLIIIGIVILALFKVKNKSVRKILYLGLVLGICTVLGGFMLNSFLGGTIVVRNESGEIAGRFQIFDAVAKYVAFNNPNDTAGPMIFAMLLGIVQVLFGQLLNAINRCKNIGWQGIFQPIGTNLILLGAFIFAVIWMYKPTADNPITNFKVGPIPIGSWINSLGDPMMISAVLFLSGVVLILLFNNIGGNIFLRPLTGLWELYGVTTGILGDILSYIRLFALGLSGGLLGNAFNQISMMPKDVPYVGIVLMILILVVGHTLNFLLAALGAFVHPLRLTFVEFYKAVGFTGGGRAFTPFSNKRNEK